MTTIENEHQVKARKDYRCNFCSLPILKGSFYFKSVHKEDEIYSWRVHKHCSEIATKLKMYDHTDEGLGSDLFVEIVKDAYMEIMSKTQNELYKSKDFKYPPFEERLLFVINHYNTSKTTTNE